jgi:tetratricopeptide (TPR) repeat protein
MIRAILVLFLSVGITPATTACLNLYFTTDKDGRTHILEEELPAFNTNFNNALIDRKLRKLNREMEDNPSFQKLSDYAVLLMKGGKVDLALSILQQISLHYPNEYRVAANLGTAYELAGEIDSALVYIQKAMELNPNAHEGSEWVHVRVLETKKALKNNPDYLINHTVLNLSDDAIKNEAIADQLLIQVQERFPFTPFPDKIMADLFYDLGNCFTETKSLRYAERFYEISYKYYRGDESRAKEKIGLVQQLKIKNDAIQPNHDNVNGDLSRLSIRYKDMFDDNNDPPHEINWDNINTDMMSLLTLNNINHIVLANKQEPILDSIPNEVPEENKSSMLTDLTKQSNNTLLFTILVAGTLILVGLFFIRRARR